MVPDGDAEAVAREALRYLHAREGDAALTQQAKAVAAELIAALPPRYVFRTFPLEEAAEGVCLAGSGVTLPGTLAARMLGGCGTAVLLACTLGLGFERRLRALERRDMGAAVLYDACGSAWVEHGCDAAEREIAARFPTMYLTDRFSPGYGDLPLSIQPAVLAALDAEKRLGIHAGGSFLMTPAKSVTAVIGISDVPQPARVRGCGFCAMKENCPYRKEGMRCAV